MSLALDTAVLQPLETVVVPATTTPLTIRDFFANTAQVRFAKVYVEFQRRFFDKTEEPLAELTYRKYKLMELVPDGPIIEELGGEGKAEGTVTAALALLRRQGNGEPGVLQTNGYANIFYARDRMGVLCAIRIGWTDDGWLLDTLSVQDPFAWNGKHEIFCPVSSQF